MSLEEREARRDEKQTSEDFYDDDMEILKADNKELKSQLRELTN